MKAGASSSGPPPTRDVEEETRLVRAEIMTLLPSNLRNQQESTLSTSLDFQAGLVADLVYYRRFSDKDAWNRSVASFIERWFANSSGDASGFSESVRQHYDSIDRAKHAPEQEEGEEEGELLCDTTFSLAYGTLLLLSHTSLRLFRGRRYGILGPNGSGKTTLMRQLRDGKVENFPPQSEVRCVMVEHALQGEDTSLSIIDFVASGL